MAKGGGRRWGAGGLGWRGDGRGGEGGGTMAHEGKVSQYYVFFSLTKANEAMFLLTNK